MRVAALALVLLVGLSYRLYLARYHTEVGIPAMASWWDYVLDTMKLLPEGRLWSYTLYAPGQTVATFLVSTVLSADPAVLRICFGVIDAVAVLALFLLGREAFSWWAGLFAAGLYALWPEGASASVNLLHDHSPQPLFLFLGLWAVLRWLRARRWWWLVGGGALLGLPAMFRADGVVVTAAVPATLALIIIASGEGWRRSLQASALLFASTLIPSLPWDLDVFLHTGRFTHIAAGDAGAAAFMRVGRASGEAGTRWNDLEVAFVSGVGESFGLDWKDSRRFGILSRHGRDVVLHDPRRYLGIVAKEAWPTLTRPAGHKLWLPLSWVNWSAVGFTRELANPEWPLALAVAASRLQLFLEDHRLFLACALLGAVGGLALSWRATAIVAIPVILWVAAFLLTMPDPRYLIMPYCLLFPLLGVVPVAVGRLLAAPLRPRKGMKAHG